MHPHSLPSAGALCLLLLLASLGCHPSEPWTSANPEFALNAFFSALQMGDDETVAAYLSDDTQRFLEDNLASAREILGADADLPDHPLDSLYRAWSPAAVDIDRLETVDRSDTEATVAVHSVFGRQSRVHMTRSQGRWIIDLTPSGAQAPSDSLTP